MFEQRSFRFHAAISLSDHFDPAFGLLINVFHISNSPSNKTLHAMTDTPVTLVSDAGALGGVSFMRELVVRRLAFQF